MRTNTNMYLIFAVLLAASVAAEDQYEYEVSTYLGDKNYYFGVIYLKVKSGRFHLCKNEEPYNCDLDSNKVIKDKVSLNISADKIRKVEIKWLSKDTLSETSNPFITNNRLTVDKIVLKPLYSGSDGKAVSYCPPAGKGLKEASFVDFHLC